MAGYRSGYALAMVGFFGFVPVVLLSPMAGALVDRYNRKKIMMLADFAAGVPTVVNLLLYASGSLQIWHLFITLSVSGAFQAFHFPAYSAAVTMMVSKKHYARASGMLSTAEFASGIFAPIVAAALLAIIGIAGIMLIDIASFLFAIGLLVFAKIPQPPTTESGLRSPGKHLEGVSLRIPLHLRTPWPLGPATVISFLQLVRRA